MYDFDFLVIGGGVAGLTYAINVAKHGKVAILFKKDLQLSSTSWAQGGIAAVTNLDDNSELHIQDTLVAGCQLNNKDIVKIVVNEGPERVRELIKMGAKFDLLEDRKNYHLNLEGGHSRRRIYHAADATGFEIQTTLLKSAKNNPNITFFTDTTAIDLITTYKIDGIHNFKIDSNLNEFNAQNQNPNKALGAYVLLSDGSIKVFRAKKILVATGGAGKIYLYTSNPDISSGDGIAMCYRAGSPVANMEFFQFHPTCLYSPKAKSFLITEAMRGEGGILRTIKGDRFMSKYSTQLELAPRDVVARAIDKEMKISGDDYVFLDISHKSESFIKEKFPNIYQKCQELGIDICKSPMPVVPAAHFCCGGVVSDKMGKTNIQNLYVAGECAHTGLHGANRLASNSLLEGLVFGYRAASDSIQSFDDNILANYNIPKWNFGQAVASDEQVIISHNWDEIRRYMWNYVGIVRSNKRLERALRRSDLIEHEINDYYWNFHITPDLIELRNLYLVSSLVIKSAIQRKESRGLHFNIDYPEISEDFVKDTII